MKPRASIGCIVLRDRPDEPVLLLRRAFGKLRGRWCFVSGSVERGESHRAAALRELLEETGLVPQELTFLRAFHGASHRVQRVFVARIVGSPAIRLDREHTEWHWSSFVEAEALLPVPAQRRALRLAWAAESAAGGGAVAAARGRGDPGP